MKKAICSLTLALVASSASASVITYENRATNAGVDKSNYQTSWNNQSSSVSTTTLDVFNGLRANGSNRHSHLGITFDVSSDRSGLDWLFQFAPDAGHGGEMYFDGNLVDRNTTDLWWGYNWNRTNDLLTALISDVSEGSHTLDLFWAEGCCDGKQSGRFSVDNGATWQTVSNKNLEAAGVSEPATLALLGLGIAGLIASRRRQS